MSNALISVVIIFYNAERFLSEAVQSVLDQTYHNWEILLVDDGSLDKSTELAKRFAASSDKIKYLEHDEHVNRGMSASRNLGIKFAQGKFITFLDSDDKFLPSKLDAQLKIFDNFEGINAVIGATKYWFSWDPDVSVKDVIQTLQIPTGIYKPGTLFKLLLEQKAATPSICSILIRKDFIEKIGGFEEKFKGMYEDQVFYAKISLEGTIFVDDNFHEMYRQHNESCYSSAKNENSVFGYKCIYLEWLKRYLDQQKVTDTSILKKLKRDQWLCRYPRLNHYYNRLLKQRRKFFPIRDI